MYIRMLNIQTKDGKKAEVLAIMDKMIPKIKALKGCKDCMFIMHDSDNHYALIVFWETVKDADEAAEIIGPDLVPHLNNLSKENIVPRLYEVYQPTSI